MALASEAPATGIPTADTPAVADQARGAAGYGVLGHGAPAGGIRVSGFTLFELLIVMLIIAIIAAIGVPSFRYISTSNRTATEVNALLGDMQFARSEATKEGQWVTVCAASVPANGVLPANANCSAGSDWTTGWIVFSDVNDDQSLDAGDTILRVQPAFAGTDTFEGDSGLSAATFNRVGFAQGFAGTTAVTLPVNITLHSTPIINSWTHCLVISVAVSPTSEGYSLVSPVCT
jgi:type IV fimbrial biogenesis protein FimT